MPLIRYPGSKAKLTNVLIGQMFPELFEGTGLFRKTVDYREPFFGCGAVTFKLMEEMTRASTLWLNDKDFWLVCLWKAVQNTPDELIELIDDFKPTADAFYQFKEQDGSRNVSPIVAGFQKLACHQMSVSGFGVMSGGPLGGRNQENANYPVSCRWNPQSLKRQVRKLHREFGQFRNVKITSGDFSKMLVGTTANTFVYLDPPYVAAGPQLYKHSFDESDHRRLAGALMECECPWVLSYDDHELVRELYGDWCDIRAVEVVYTNARVLRQTSRPKNHEVVVTRGR